MLLLAEQLPAPDSFQGIGWMIVCLSAIVLIVERGMALYGHFKPSPPAGELHLTAAGLAKRIEDLETQRAEDLKTGSERRQKIYAELKSQREDMLKLVDKIYERIDENEKENSKALRALPNDIITTLRNTGVIK